MLLVHRHMKRWTDGRTDVVSTPKLSLLASYKTLRDIEWYTCCNFIV